MKGAVHEEAITVTHKTGLHFCSTSRPTVLNASEPRNAFLRTQEEEAGRPLDCFLSPFSCYTSNKIHFSVVFLCVFGSLFCFFFPIRIDFFLSFIYFPSFPHPSLPSSFPSLPLLLSLKYNTCQLPPPTHDIPAVQCD